MKTQIKHIVLALVAGLTLYSHRLAASGIISPEKFIRFKVIYEQGKLGDTLLISIGDMLSIARVYKLATYHAVNTGDGIYNFSIPVNEEDHGYMVLLKPRDPEFKAPNFEAPVRMTQPLFWEAGDSLTWKITFNEDQIGGKSDSRFTGSGSTKYSVKEKFKGLKIKEGTEMITADNLPKSFDGNILNYNCYDCISAVRKARLEILDSAKKTLTELSYHTLKADVIYENHGLFNKITSAIYEGKLHYLNSRQKRQIIMKLDQSFDQRNNYGISDEGLNNSFGYIAFINAKLQAQSYLNLGVYSLDWIYKQIVNSKLSDRLKETQIMAFLWRPVFNADNPDVIYNDAYRFVKNKRYRLLLDSFRKIVPGNNFPDFELEHIDGTTKKLADFKGKAVLIDFWFTGCAHCEVLFTSVLSKVAEKFSGNPNLAIISISIDRDRDVWKKSILTQKYTSLHAVNLYTGGLRNKHPLILETNIISYPCVVLLDKTGRIKYFDSKNLHEEVPLIEAINSVIQ